MDVTAAFITIAIAAGSLTPGQNGPAPQLSLAPIAAALASSPAFEQGLTDPSILRRLSAAQQQAASRPSALIPMYASLVALQGFDIYTTSAAIKRGAVEANPLVKPVAGRNTASVLVKAAATAGSIYFTERAWKKNRKGAIVLMTALNVATAAIVAHNTQVRR